MKIVGKNAAREILNSSNIIECIYLNLVNFHLVYAS